jgi:hypothetical protein
MTRLILGLLVLLPTFVAAQTREPAPARVAGTWRMTMEMSMGTASPEITLKQEGDTLSGTYSGRYGTFALTGKVKGRLFEFSFLMNEQHPVSMCFQGEVSADGTALEGTAVLAELGDANWTATKDESPKPKP